MSSTTKKPFTPPPFKPQDCVPMTRFEKFRLTDQTPTTLAPKTLSAKDEVLRGQLAPFVRLIRSRGGLVNRSGHETPTRQAYRVHCPFCCHRAPHPDRAGNPPGFRDGDRLAARLVRYISETPERKKRRMVGFSCPSCCPREVDIFDFFATLGPNRCPDIESELERLATDGRYGLMCYLDMEYAIGFPSGKAAGCSR